MNLCLRFKNIKRCLLTREHQQNKIFTLYLQFSLDFSLGNKTLAQFLFPLPASLACIVLHHLEQRKQRK